MSASIGAFLTGTAVFFVLKLTSSVDDILWLSPFLAIADDDLPAKVRCCGVYCAVCLLVTAEAFGIAFAASRGVGAAVGALDGEGGEDGEGEFWDASTILCMIASACIALFACKEYREWREERAEEKEVERQEGGDGVTGKADRAEGYEDEPTVGTACTRPSTPTSESKGSANGEKAAASCDDLPPSLLVPDAAEQDEDGGSCTSSLETPKCAGVGDYKSFRHIESTCACEEEACVQMNPISDGQAGDSFVVEGDEECGIVQTRPLVQLKEHHADDDFSNEAEVGTDGGKEQHTLVSLFVVAFFGTLDDLAIFSAVLMGKSIQWLSLLCGSMLAAAVIIFASWCMSLCRPFADFMQRIPLWALLFAIALYIFIDGMI